MKIVFPTPVVYDGNDSKYLQRDGARLAEYFAKKGHTAIKLILDDGKGLPQPISPLLQKASYEDWCSPKFWQDTAADVVLLYGGLSPNMLPVAKAIKQSNAKLILKMDSASGIVGFFDNTIINIKRTFWFSKQKKNSFYSILVALIRQFSMLVKRRNKFLTEYLTCFDLITAENPYAVQTTKKWLIKNNLEDISKRVEFMSHPVPEHFIYTKNNLPKENTIIAVAMNWANPLKRGKLLGKSISLFLEKKSNWEAIIVGNNTDVVTRQISKNLISKVEIHPPMPSNDIQPLYSKSKIFILPSGSEGAPNVLTESLCCGCSEVIAPELLHLNYIETNGDGSLAAKSTPREFCKAIFIEAEKWETKQHNPLSISQKYCSKFHTSMISHLIENFFKGI